MLWPSLLTRYVTAELLKVFLVALTSFTALMMVVGVAQEAVRQGLGLGPILRLIPYTIPNALVFAVPGTILFSVCSVFGRMASANEIIAVKSLGISPLALVRPALVLAVAISLMSVWLIEVAFTWGYHGVRRVVLESVEEIAYGALRARRTYGHEKFSITVARVEGHRLIRPTITMIQSNGEQITMTAREAELFTIAGGEALKITLTDGAVEVGGDVAMRFPDTIEQRIPLATGGPETNPSHMRLRDIPAAEVAQRRRVKQFKAARATDAAWRMMTGDLAGLAAPDWRQKADRLENEVERLHRLDTEPYRRWASGFSCLAFVMIGAPLAIRMRTSDFLTTFGVCFLPILVVYYPLFAFGLGRAKNGALPPQVVWLGNLVCFTIGLWLLRKVARY